MFIAVLTIQLTQLNPLTAIMNKMEGELKKQTLVRSVLVGWPCSCMHAAGMHVGPFLLASMYST